MYVCIQPPGAAPPVGAPVSSGSGSARAIQTREVSECSRSDRPLDVPAAPVLLGCPADRRDAAPGAYARSVKSADGSDRCPLSGSCAARATLMALVAWAALAAWVALATLMALAAWAALAGWAAPGVWRALASGRG
jgi:hypothetical protein